MVITLFAILAHYALLFFVHWKQINSPDDVRCAPERVHLTHSGMDALPNASSGESSVSTDSTDYMYLFQRNKGTK